MITSRHTRFVVQAIDIFLKVGYIGALFFLCGKAGNANLSILLFLLGLVPCPLAYCTVMRELNVRLRDAEHRNSDSSRK